MERLGRWLQSRELVPRGKRPRARGWRGRGAWGEQEAKMMMNRLGYATAYGTLSMECVFLPFDRSKEFRERASLPSFAE
eukprot:556484-Prymnesium_polylepis.1